MGSETAATPVPSRAGWDGVWTLPNLITMLRLACIPWFLWLLLDVGNRTDAALLLGLLDADAFLGGDMPLDASLSEESMACVAHGLGMS
ncbi:MAG: CDP-alcohol phosphatidyltransferase family protein, partial [Acidimicrobiales bacterium]